MRMDKRFPSPYDHSKADPNILPLLSLMHTRGLSTMASCAGFGPSPASGRKTHDSWMDMPLVVLDPAKCGAPFQAILDALKDNPMPLGEANGIQVEIITTAGNTLYADLRSWKRNRAPTRDWILDGMQWADMRHCLINMVGGTDVGSTPLLAAIASSWQGLPQWLNAQKRLWVKTVTKAVGSMPMADQEWLDANPLTIATQTPR
jgi:hypothetical protein